MDGHDEEQIDLRQMRLDRGERRGRIQSEAGATAALANQPQSGGDIVFRLRFDVDGDRVRARFREARDVMIGPLDHEMDVEWQRR